MSGEYMYPKNVLAAAVIAALAAPAMGQAVTIETKVFVETYVAAKDGTVERQLRPATTVVPGDRLVYTIAYRNSGPKPAADFQITNPIATGVAFAGEESVGAEMSADGGKSWAPLAQLSVRAPDGTTRPARRDELTHIRWRFAQPIAAGASGQVSFKARLK